MNKKSSKINNIKHATNNQPSPSQYQLSINNPVNSLPSIKHGTDNNIKRLIIISFLKQPVDNMLILLPVLQNVLPINPLSVQSRQKLNSPIVIRVQVNVVHLALHACVADCKVNVVNVLPVLVLVFFLHQVLLVEFTQCVLEVAEHLVKWTTDSHVFTVVFLILIYLYLDGSTLSVSFLLAALFACGSGSLLPASRSPMLSCSSQLSPCPSSQVCRISSSHPLTKSLWNRCPPSCTASQSRTSLRCFSLCTLRSWRFVSGAKWSCSLNQSAILSTSCLRFLHIQWLWESSQNRMSSYRLWSKWVPFRFWSEF